MSSKERNIVFLIVLALVVGIVYLFSYKQPDYTDDHNNKIKVLDLKVDSLHTVNKGLTLKVDSLNTQIHDLDRQIGLKDNKINNLRYETKIKVSAVDSFTDDELERFFTERYRQYLDSIKKTNSPSSN